MEVQVVPFTQSPAAHAVRRFARLALPLVAALCAPACVVKTNASLASDTSGAEDVNQTESNVEVLATSFVGTDGASVATASYDFAGDVKALTTTTTTNPGFYFQPAGCVQVTTDNAAARTTYVFSDCTGPLGLAHLNGTIAVSWQIAPSALTLNFSAQNFSINGATITSWLALATITANGNARAMTWNATLEGTTSTGRAFQRQNQKSVQWTVGQACLAVDGQSTGTISGAHLQTTITGYQRCVGACPQQGSEIQVDNLDTGNSIDIVYSGGREAELTINGKTETIALLCGG